MNVAHGRDGYSVQDHQAWEFAFQLEMRTIPDDGSPLLATDWVDLNLLGKLFFQAPTVLMDDDLWAWRTFARTAIQRAALKRLYHRGVITILDGKRNYLRLSANGYRKVARVWHYIREASHTPKEAIL